MTRGYMLLVPQEMEGSSKVETNPLYPLFAYIHHGTFNFGTQAHS